MRDEQRTVQYQTSVVRVLGTFEVGSTDKPVVVDGMLQRLLALLVGSVNESVTVDRLCEAIWGDSRPKTYQSGLRGHISRARNVLEQAGATFSITAKAWGDEPAYCLAMAADDVDHTYFSRLASRAGVEFDEVADLEAALQLWRGAALAGIDLVDLTALTVQLEERRTAVAERLSVLYLSRGRSADAASLLQPFHEQNLEREQTTLHLARALYADNRQQEALEVCQATRVHLRDVFGLVVSPSVAELEHLILNQDESLKPRPAHLDTVYLDALLHFARGPLVGRDAVTSRLRTLVESTIEGVGGAVLISGDVGTGKTRMLAETARHAIQTSAWCIHVSVPGPSTEPFALARALTRRLANGPSPELNHAAARLKTAFDAFEGAINLSEATESLDLAVDELIDVIARGSQPIVVVLDDLQWVDSSSLALLRKLSRRPARHLGLVMAARSGSHTRSWDDFVADVPSTTVRIVAIDALSTREISQWMAQLGANFDIPTDTIATLVHRQTSGVAFLVAGVVDDLIALGDGLEAFRWLHSGHLPERLADPLRARIGRLHNRDIQMLAVAAVISPHPDPTEVARICSSLFEPGEWLIDERRALGLIRHDPTRPGMYMFEHALTRTALQGLLSGEERRVAHRAAAETRMHDPAQASAVASHLVEAIPLVTPAAALHALVTAARRAADVFAFDEAAALYQKALAVQSAYLPDSATMELDLRIGFLRALQQLGARRAALPHFEETLSRAESLRLWDKVAECALAAADFGEVLDRDDPIRHLLIRALDVIPHDHPRRGQIAVEAVIKHTIIEGRSGHVLRLFHDELDHVDDATLINERSRAWLHINAGSPNALARLHAATELQQASPDQTGRSWLDATLFRLSAELELGNTDRAERLVQPFQHASNRSGRPGARWLALVATADIEQLHGRLHAGQVLAEAALRFGSERAVPDAGHSFTGHSLVISALRGTVDELAHINQGGLPDAFENAVGASAAAMVLALNHRNSDAALALSDAVVALQQFPTSTLTPFSIALCAETWMRIGRPAASTAALLDLVQPYAGTMWRMALVGSSLGPVDRHLGALLASVDDPGWAAALERAVELARQARAPVWELASAVELASLTRRPDHLDTLARLTRGTRVVEAVAVVESARDVLAAG